MSNAPRRRSLIPASRLGALAATALALGLSSCGGCEECPPGRTLCDGYCADLSSDVVNCGACFIACGPAESCMERECTCAAPSMICNGACVDLPTDPENCGGCGVTCFGDTPFCDAGDCITCPSEECGRIACEFAICDGACVNIFEDRQNCGECGHVCSADETCLGAECVGGNGTCDESCDTSRGFVCCDEPGPDRCADLNLDENHCARCEWSCGLDGSCKGECEPS